MNAGNGERASLAEEGQAAPANGNGLRNGNADLQVPRRQHVTGLVLFLGLNIVRGIRAFVPLFIAMAVSEQFKFPVLAGSVALGAVLVAWTILEFLRFTYHVEKGDTFVVERGVFRRERLEIPISRIQAVHLTRGVLQRALGLTGLAIDTAGSDESELQLRALRFEEAQRLRRLLSPVPVAQEADEEGAPIVALTPRDLIRIGLTMNHFRNGMIAFGGVVGLGGQITDLVVGRIEALPAWQMMMFSLLSALFWVFGIFLFASIGVLISMALAVVRFYGLKVELAGDRLELASGLFRRNEFSILLRKVQILKFRSSWLQRAFDLEGLTLHQARSSSDAAEQAVKLAIPGLMAPQSQRLLRIFCPSWNPGAAHVRTLRPIAFHRWLAIGGYALFISVPTVLFGVLAGMPLLATLLAVAGWGYAWFAGSRLHASLETRTDGEVIEMREGWFVQRRSILRAHQLQRVTLTRNLLQIRRGSATLHLHTAAGTVTLRHIPHDVAAPYADELLARIEQHDGPWM